MKTVKSFAIARKLSTFETDSYVEKANFFKRTGYSKEMTKKQKFDHFLVLDFEATCDSPRQVDPMEIIEFPVIKVNAETFELEETFHHFVRPVRNPELSTFCTQLTGIVQDMVNNEETFPVVFHKFNKWLEEVGLLTSDNRYLKSFTFVTCGNWDLQIMLPEQCKLYQERIPLHMRTWINIKKSFAAATGVWPKNLNEMMAHLNIKQIGKLHSGIDDCRNIVQIMEKLATSKNFVFQNTSSEW